MITPTAGSPGLLSTVITGYTSQTFTTEVATSNSALAGTYTVTVTSTVTENSATGTGSFTLTVIDPCNNASLITITSATFTSWTFTQSVYFPIT